MTDGETLARLRMRQNLQSFLAHGFIESVYISIIYGIWFHRTARVTSNSLRIMSVQARQNRGGRRNQESEVVW